MNRLKTLAMLPLIILAIACGNGEQSKSIVITNPLAIERQELVAVPYAEFMDAFGTDSVFRVLDRVSGSEIPYQLETKGTATHQNILFYVSVPASGEVTLTVEKSA